VLSSFESAVSRDEACGGKHRKMRAFAGRGCGPPALRAGIMGDYIHLYTLSVFLPVHSLPSVVCSRPLAAYSSLTPPQTSPLVRGFCRGFQTLCHRIGSQSAGHACGPPPGRGSRSASFIGARFIENFRTLVRAAARIPEPFRIQPLRLRRAAGVRRACNGSVSGIYRRLYQCIMFYVIRVIYCFVKSINKKNRRVGEKRENRAEKEAIYIVIQKKCVPL